MIKGFIGTSLIDYPDKIAAVVFYGGCNFRCPYCQNTSLVSEEKLQWMPEIEEEEIVNKISNRAGFIDGVVFSGGEPTLYGDSLSRIMTQIKTMQTCHMLKIKLDTNGSNPGVLKQLLEKNLLDFVAMDIKTSTDRYDEITGFPQSLTRINQSIELLKNSSIDYEFRVTVVPTVITQSTLVEIAEKIKDTRKLVLQQFRPKNTLDLSFQTIQPYTNQEIHHMADVVRSSFPFEVIVRT
jgi:pyruvate formate lyase activating enzyme